MSQVEEKEDSIINALQNAVLDLVDIERANLRSQAQACLDALKQEVQEARAQVAAVAVAEKGSIPEFAKRLEAAENFFEARAEVWDARHEHLDQKFDDWTARLNEIEASSKARLEQIQRTADGIKEQVEKSIQEFNSHAQLALGVFDDAVKTELKKVFEKGELTQIVVKALAETYKGGIIPTRPAQRHEWESAVIVRPATHVEIAQAQGRA